MKISIIHPSRNRAMMAAKTANKWLTSAKKRGEIQYIVCVDADDEDIELYKELLPNDVELKISTNKSAIEAINYGSTFAENDLLVVVSDDFSCPFHWDKYLINELSGKSDFLVKTYDGAQPWIITLPIMDRVYYKRFGYIYHPEYRHMFADTEMTHVGHLLGKVIELDVTFKHNHYTSGETAKDHINDKNDRSWAHGEEVYLTRLMRDFDLKETATPKIAMHHITWLKSKGIQVETI